MSESFVQVLSRHSRSISRACTSPYICPAGWIFLHPSETPVFWQFLRTGYKKFTQTVSFVFLGSSGKAKVCLQDDITRAAVLISCQTLPEKRDWISLANLSLSTENSALQFSANHLPELGKLSLVYEFPQSWKEEATKIHLSCYHWGQLRENSMVWFISFKNLCELKDRGEQALNSISLNEYSGGVLL